MKTLIIKNVILHILLIPFYLFAQYEIASIPEIKLDTLVLFVWLIVIAPITSNFIYSYWNAKSKKSLNFWHITTFLSTLVIWMLFIILDILLFEMIGSVLVFRISILLFWFAVISFDFADWKTRKN